MKLLHCDKVFPILATQELQNQMTISLCNAMCSHCYTEIVTCKVECCIYVEWSMLRGRIQYMTVYLVTPGYFLLM